MWSIACFFIVRRLRGTGIMKRMIAAAVSHARKRGAKVVEAYPVDADSPSYRFMGFVPVFEEAGFARSRPGRQPASCHAAQAAMKAEAAAFAGR